MILAGVMALSLGISFADADSIGGHNSKCLLHPASWACPPH